MVNEKVLLIVLDGLGDRPIAALNNLTPLENARTPNMSVLLEKAQCGLMDPIGVGIRPASDLSLITLLGYSPEKYYTGRGPLEALGTGMQPKPGDLCFRANFATVDSQMKVVDRRAGRIREGAAFEKALNGISIDGVKFLFKSGIEHRGALIMRGDGLSEKISEIDSHAEGKRVLDARPLDSSPQAKRTAELLNEFVKRAHAILKKHPENKKRTKMKQPSANYLLVRGPGTLPSFPAFKDVYGMKGACIAGDDLYKGMSRAIGFEVVNLPSATARSDTDLLAKMVAGKRALAANEFVLVHVKGTDLFGHDGDFVGKRNFIERVDTALKEVTGLQRTLVVLTADHSTPCELKNHSGDPVPVFFSMDGIRRDSVKKFGERECAKGIVGRIKGSDLINEIMNLTGRAALRGS